jgi:hypothetical protein
MFVWLPAEQVIICSTLTKRKCDTTPRRHVCVYTAQLHLSEVIIILHKSTVKSAARIANVSITRTAQVFTECTFALFPPSLRLEDGDSRAAPLCTRTVLLVVCHAEHADAAV